MFKSRENWKEPENIFQDHFNIHSTANTRMWNPGGVNLHYVIFCGKLYVGFSIVEQVRKNGALLSRDSKIFWDTDSIEKYVNASESKDLKKTWDLSNEISKGRYARYYKPFSKLRVGKFYEKVLEYNKDNKDFLDKIMVEADAPVILISHGIDKSFARYNKTVRSVVKNPELKELNFASAVDPWQAFQELSMYLTNVIGIKENPTVDIEDKYKISEHGYNEKSFRNPIKEKDL
jgi:hypothetical protein